MGGAGGIGAHVRITTKRAECFKRDPTDGWTASSMRRKWMIAILIGASLRKPRDMFIAYWRCLDCSSCAANRFHLHGFARDVFALICCGMFPRIASSAPAISLVRISLAAYRQNRRGGQCLIYRASPCDTRH